jgi:hypothetical protein
MRKALPIAAAILCGLLALVDFFIVDARINAAGAILVEGVTILAAFALLLGILNILNVHGRRLTTRGERGGVYSVFLILGLLATLAFGIMAPASVTMAWVFDHVYLPLQATLAALLAFFAVSAAYRAFRLRSLEAVILLMTSLFVLLALLPFSEAITPIIPAVRDWLFAVPVAAGTRGIILGVSLGTIATAMRILLAVDQPYAGE